MTRAQICSLILFAAMFTLALGALLLWPPREARAGLDLHAQAHTGEEVRLSALPGELRLVYFGFMNCPDVCLDAALSIGSALKSLEASDPDARAQVVNVFVTLDPADDVIEGPYNELAAYLDSRYGGQGIALRPATKAEAQTMASAYGIAFEYVEDEFFPLGYRVDHASLIFLTNKAGRILEFYADATPGRVIAHEIQAHLAALGPA